MVKIKVKLAVVSLTWIKVVCKKSVYGLCSEHLAAVESWLLIEIQLHFAST